MSNQLQITGGAKVRNLEGVLTGTSGVVGALGINVANGIPKLDSNAKILVSQLPNSVMEYKGTWNAATNTPTLANGTGNQGDVYLCNVAGTTNFGAGAITFAVGDQVIYSGTIWQKAGGSTGTVTSVAITESGDALTITGSPITTSGTINIGFAGTSGQYINGAGGLTTFPSLTGYVPYTGATSNVDLGEYELKAGQLTLDVSPTGTATVGTTRWNDSIGSSETTLKGGSVILKNGVDLVTRVVNKVTPNTTLTKAAYPAVRVSGAQGQRLAVAYAQANNDNNSADTLGIVIETIATNQEGFIMTVGQLSGVNTTGSLQGETWADGDVLYLSPTTPGALTNIKPNGLTGHIVVMGYVEYSHSINGSIYVKVMNGWELDELHNVYITSPTNNQGLFYNSSNSLWENKSIATALGYTPANDSLVVHLAGNETITGIKTFSAATEFTSSQSVAFNYGLGIAKGNTPSIFSSSAVYLYSSSGNNNLIIKDNTNTSKLQFQAASSYTYTFPASTGTIALTSDIPSLTGYVPYTGATSSVSLGSYQLTASVLTASNGGNGNVVTDYLSASKGIFLTDTLSGGQWASGITNIVARTAGILITHDAGGGILNFNTSATYSYVFPAANGTVALTSDIPSLANYVTLTGASQTISSSKTFTTFPTTFRDVVIDGSGTSASGVNLKIASGGLSSSGSGYITLYSSASKNLFVFDGTTTTTAALDFSSITSGITRTFTYPDANGTLVLGTGTTNYLPKFTGASTIGDSAISDNGTNVGIGTTSPSGLLHLYGTSPYFILQGSEASAKTLYIRENAGGMFFGEYGVATRMMISSSGNVGIGTSSPGALLEIANASNPSMFVTNTGAATLRLQAATGVVYAGSKTADNFDLITGDTPRMRITSAGNVGIGTSSPVGKLHIVGGSGNGNTLRLDSYDNAGDNWIGFYQNNGTRIGYMGYGYSASNIMEIFQEANEPLIISTNATERMRITSGGNVGIASTPPSNVRLGVFGASATSSDYAFACYTNVGGNLLYIRNDGYAYVAANAWVYGSDLRLKENISDVESGLDMVLKMKPKHYDYINGTKENIGFIAQDIQEIIPQAVSVTNEETGMLGLKTDFLVPYLVKAIQELSAKVSALENKA